MVGFIFFFFFLIAIEFFWHVCGQTRQRACSRLAFQRKWRVKLSANWLYSSLSATLNQAASDEHRGLPWPRPCSPLPTSASHLHFHAFALISVSLTSPTLFPSLCFCSLILSPAASFSSCRTSSSSFSFYSFLPSSLLSPASHIR